MRMRFAKGVIPALVSFALLMLWGISALAATWNYSFPITIIDTTNTTRVNLPVLLGFGGTSLVNAGYTTSGLDTNLQDGTTNRTYMMGTTQVLAVVPSLPSGGQVTYNLYTGYSPVQTLFSIITGIGGYFTVPDGADSMEMSDNFSLEQLIGVDTSVSANITSKPYAFGLASDGAGNLVATANRNYNALDFVSGSNDWVNLTDQTDFSFTDGAGNDLPFSVTFWMNIDDATSKSLVTKSTAAGNNIEWIVNTDASDCIQAQTYLNDGTASIGRRTGVITGYEDTWHHIAVTYSGNETNGGFNIYIDGVDSDTTDTGAGVYTGMTNGTASAALGAIDAGATESYDGGLAEVKIWKNRVLTPAEVTADMAGTTSATSLVGYWKISEGAGNPKDYSFKNYNATNNGADWITTFTNSLPQASITAASVSAAAHTVIVNGAPYILASSTASHFDGTVNSYINTGTLYNTSENTTVSISFKFDSTFNGGATKDLFWKSDGVNVIVGYLRSDNANLEVYTFDGASTVLTVTKPAGGWIANTWYNVIFSNNSVSGMRLRLDGGTATTSPVIFTLPTGGDLIFGNRSPTAANNIAGHIANVRIWNITLSAAQELQTYQGDILGTEHNFWYTDEGTGTSIISYGSASNNATAGSANSWATTSRPCKFAFSIDGTAYGGFAQPVTIPNSASGWTFMSNATRYATYIKEYVGGTLKAWYQPNAMISGTTLPDRTTYGNTGTIVWGSNTGITIVYGAMSGSSSTSVSTTNVTGGFAAPSIVMPGSWFAAGDNLTALPFFATFNATATSIGMPVQTLYFIPFWGLCLAVALLCFVYIRSAFIGMAFMILLLFVGSHMTIVPMWIPFSILIVSVGLMYLYRQVAY